MRSVRVYRQQLPGFKLLAGTGTPSLTESIELTKLAFDLGYDGVVVLPPITSARQQMKVCSLGSVS